MTQVTPPGWYADPGQTNDGPPTERWWDGKAWTDQTRPAGSAAAWGPPGQPPAYGAPAAPSAYGAYPGYGYPAQPPAGPRRGLRIGIAVAAAVAVLASIGVGAYALTHDDGGKDRATSRQQRPDGPGGDSGGSGGDSGGPGGDSPSPAPSEAPKVKGGGTVQDPFNGISMPVPEGWTGQTIRGGAAITSDHAYKCPGAASQQCTPGGAYSAPALVLGTKGDTAEQVAKADVAANAKQSYGGSAYGGITSHQVLAAKPVTVAGQKGYLVRWKAVTSKGADGYVESLAFPSPNDAKQIVVVRFGVDVGQPLSVIDDVTKGIKVSSGGGNGQSV
ncbi:DUF2510 domain-containing protein [Streptomyces sp. L2]|uniref:DUF2510 domain-containing protein n=1 Tax=Streptomyces sp. L2 TaxID=2162665 RepID=UPI00101365A5|nr:DUF2510 domain-containing protein [Streptomyces sp. L2]